MATIPEIKTNLFSFSTFRSPDKIDPVEKELYFIEHPDLSQSYFNSCLEITLILTTLKRFKLTTLKRSMLTTPKRSMLTT